MNKNVLRSFNLLISTSLLLFTDALTQDKSPSLALLKGMFGALRLNKIVTWIELDWIKSSTIQCLVY